MDKRKFYYLLSESDAELVRQAVEVAGIPQSTIAGLLIAQWATGRIQLTLDPGVQP